MVEATQPKATKPSEKAVVAKRRYVSPKLQEYGRLSDLTQGGPGVTPDGLGGSKSTFFAPDE